jgi:hypothetical protein
MVETAESAPSLVVLCSWLSIVGQPDHLTNGHVRLDLSDTGNTDQRAKNGVEVADQNQFTDQEHAAFADQDIKLTTLRQAYVRQRTSNLESKSLVSPIHEVAPRHILVASGTAGCLGF